jgi:hypothetical protein
VIGLRITTLSNHCLRARDLVVDSVHSGPFSNLRSTLCETKSIVQS